MNPLNKTLHILRKDVRHLYPEILLNLALLIAFAWIVPAQWPGAPASESGFSITGGVFNLIAVLLHVLLPIAWLVLISRLIHDESLVGDRQFWLSRPYTWYTLLATKLLFLAIFLYLPLFLMQLYLLQHAGLHPAASIPALLANLFSLTLAFFLPFTVIAAITSTFGRLALTILGGLLYLVLVFVPAGYLNGTRAAAPYTEHLNLALAFLLPAAVLIFQYITRRTRQASAFLLATPIVLALVILLAPANLLFHLAYPDLPASGIPAQAGIGPGINPQATFLTDPAYQQPSNGPLLLVRNNVSLTLPIALSGIPEDAQLEARALSLTVDAPDGFHWTSNWQPVGNILRTGPVPLGLLLPASVLARVAAHPVNLQLAVAFQQLETLPAVTAITALDPYAVPNGGLCSYIESSTLRSPFPTPFCRYPLHSPPFTLISAPVVQDGCPLDGSSVPSNQVGSGILGRDNGMPLSLDPVQTEMLRFHVAGESPTRPQPNMLCPGTQVTFTTYRPRGQYQLHLTQPAVYLAPYAVHEQKPGPNSMQLRINP